MMVQFVNKYRHNILSIVWCFGLMLVIAGFSEKPCLAADNNGHSNLVKSSKKADHVIDIKPLSANKTAQIEKRWGVKLQGIHITAAGHMLDFRFQVTEPKKAAPLLDMKNKPLIIAEKNGVKLEVPNVPRIGALRQNSREVKSGMIFTILFANPGKMVATGEKLTVHIGQFLVEHLTVGDILNKPDKRTI